MRASPEDRAALANNILLVMTYWFSFQRLRQPGTRTTVPANLHVAAYQVLSLVAPFLVGDAKLLLERLRREYIG
jgi:hypothetical protein